MPPFAPSHGPFLARALSAALGVALACGVDDPSDEPTGGIAEAFHQLAEHECSCLAQDNGFSDEVEDLCIDRFGDIEQFFPASCLAGVVERHPEAGPVYDCAADVMRQYVECIVREGCHPSEDDTTCETTLSHASAACPQPPRDTHDEIEACFQAVPCGDGSEVPEDARCDGEADCAGGEDEVGCGRLEDRRLDLRRHAAATSTSDHNGLGLAWLRQPQPADPSRSGLSPGSVPVGSLSAAMVSEPASAPVPAPVPVTSLVLPAVSSPASSPPPVVPVDPASCCTS